MLYSDVQIENAVDKFFINLTRKFSTEEMFQTLRDNLKSEDEFIEDRIYDIGSWHLQLSKKYVMLNEEKDDEKIFMSRHALFSNAEFCVKPLTEEIEQGILIQGHRFLPFCDYDEKIKVKDAFSKKLLKRKKAKVILDDLLKYYSLFDVFTYMKILTSENDNNFINMANTKKNGGKIEAVVSAFDFKSFYQQHNFQEGDLVLFSTKNYDKSQYTISYLSVDEQNKRKNEIALWQNRFNAEFEQIVRRVSDNDFVYGNKSLLAETFLNARELLKNPACRFLDVEGCSMFRAMGGNSLFWKNEIDFEHIEIIPEGMDFDDDEEYDEDSPLDFMCKVMGFELDEEDISAYMRDELFLGSNSLENVKIRCFDERIVKDYSHFVDEFEEELLDLWDEIKDDYNIFLDNPQGHIRKRCLGIKDMHMKWLRGLDRKEVKITPGLEKKFRKLYDHLLPVFDTIYMLNKPVELSSKEINKINKALDVFEERLPLDMERISDSIT